LALPAALDNIVASYRWDRDRIGSSPSEVFRLERAGSPALYLKREVQSLFGELAGEAARLTWLQSTGLRGPDLITFVREDGYDWLLMHALAGRDLASQASLAPRTRVSLLASALRSLHAIDVGSCPFDHRWHLRLDAAERRMRTGLVDEDDFDPERTGMSALSLFSDLSGMAVDDEDLVVTHGDACLPNFVASDDGALSGFIDCGRLGVADRYQDIALACRSIASNFGQALVQPFCDDYGLVLPDVNKIKRYQMLDEFF
jgi:aminoglycoside 3'-phosphotransferase-2